MDKELSTSTDLISAYLDAVMRRDETVIDRYFDPDVEYMVNGTPAPDPAGVLPSISADCHTALPWLGLYRGREALNGFLSHMHRNLEVTAFGPREVISEGSKGAAFGWFRLRSFSTGRTADISYSILFEVRDGMIARYHFLENTFDVAATFRTGGSWLVDTDDAPHRVPSSLEESRSGR